MKKIFRELHLLTFTTPTISLFYLLLSSTVEMAIFGKIRIRYTFAQNSHIIDSLLESGIGIFMVFLVGLIFTGLLLIISFVLCTSKCVENHTRMAPWRIVIVSIVANIPTICDRLVPAFAVEINPNLRTHTSIALHLTLSDIFTFLCILITLLRTAIYIFKTLDQKQPSAQAPEK